VRTISAEITRFLLAQDCKLIVVACNTASAAALEALRAEFDVPIVGLEPALKPAAEATQTGHIGILATIGTIRGNRFQTTRQRYAEDIQVHIQIGHRLVEQIEAGQFDTPATERLLRQYLEPMLVAGVDHIVLGCTHYPLVLPLIRHIVDGRATVIDPAQAVARQVARTLATRAALPPGLPNGRETEIPRHTFYTSGQLQPLTALATAFSQKEVQVIQVAMPEYP
jgi:glutamate racemase